MTATLFLAPLWQRLADLSRQDSTKHTVYKPVFPTGRDDILNRSSSTCGGVISLRPRNDKEMGGPGYNLVGNYLVRAPPHLELTAGL